MNAQDREEEALVEAFNRGDIDRTTYNREMAQLQRDARAAAEEMAEREYERVMDDCGFGRW